MEIDRPILAVSLLALGSLVAVRLDAQAPSTAPSSGPTYPMQLLSGPGSGPALYLGAGRDAAVIGYLSENVPVELVEPPSNGRVLVRIRSGMRVRAHLDATRLGARIERRGRLRGTPAYVAGGDLVRVLSLDADGRAHVAAEVTLGGRKRVFEGTFPIVGLGADIPAESDETRPPGERAVIHATAPVDVRDQPNGAVIETLAAGSYPCRLVQASGGVYSVLIGTGPYLAGFVTVEPTTADLADLGPTPTGHTGHAIPARLRSETNYPLVRLPAGTRINFDGQTIALLDEPGLARVIERREGDGEADVFVAVDDRIAVRGVVALTALGEVVPSN